MEIKRAEPRDRNQANGPGRRDGPVEDGPPGGPPGPPGPSWNGPGMGPPAVSLEIPFFIMEGLYLTI